MMVAYLRSSSIGTWRLCQFDYFLSYVCGVPKPGNKKADFGNMVHKALELLARRKLAEQRGEAALFDPESRETVPASRLTTEEAILRGWNAYKAKHADFGPADWRLLEHQVKGVLRTPYSPLGLDIVEPELYFDLEIPGDWARWSLTDPHTGEAAGGRLSIKGAMDLIVRDGPGHITYVDWKTGARKDWATGKAKTYESLMTDPQLLLYYYALRRIYPAERVTMVIYYVRDGGPYVLPYGDREYELAERKLRQYFEEIRDAAPARIYEDPARNFPCRSFCHFGKVAGPSGRPLCEEHWAEVQALGMDRVVARIGRPGHAYRYGGGGGVTDRAAGGPPAAGKED
jgi:RecB family exonuclease